MCIRSLFTVNTVIFVAIIISIIALCVTLYLSRPETCNFMMAITSGVNVTRNLYFIDRGFSQHVEGGFW